MPETLERVVEAGDVLVNAAGYLDDGAQGPESQRRLHESNVIGPDNLARVAASRGAAQLIHISSVAAMGRWRGSGITESMMRDPESEYGWSKLHGEERVLSYAGAVPVTILRPTSVFGEGRGLAAVLCRLASMPIVPIPGWGSALVPFTYVGNVCRAVELAVRSEATYGRTFIIGDRHSYSLQAIIAAFAMHLGSSPRFLPIPVVVARGATRFAEVVSRLRRRAPTLSASRLRTITESVSYSIAQFEGATGYEPPYDLDAAAARIASWYRSNARAAHRR